MLRCVVGQQAGLTEHVLFILLAKLEVAFSVAFVNTWLWHFEKFAQQYRLFVSKLYIYISLQQLVISLRCG